MMIGELSRSFPTVQIPPWDPYDDPTAHAILTSPSSLTFCSNAGPSGDYSSLVDSFAALHRYLPSNDFPGGDCYPIAEDLDLPLVDAYSCDQFRMFEFKVRRCVRGRSHDWTECPYAHPGEKARRRDPRKFHYSGTACPEFRKGGCKRGDSCEFAHGVFECWLHPARYRTQPCKDGPACRRRVCFFAHTPEQLRILPEQSPRAHEYSSESEYGTPIRHAFDSYLAKGSFVPSPTSILTSHPISPPSDSPPMSPNSPQLGGGSFNSVSELVAPMRNLQVAKVKMSPRSSWGSQGSPRGPMIRVGLCSQPTTPTPSGLCPFEIWNPSSGEEEPAMERVESGRGLRASLYARLSKENSLE